MNLGDAAEQIVKIAHDVLVSADPEHAEIINFAGNHAMQRKGIAHVLEIGELGNFSVRIAGDVDDRALSIRTRGQPMDRHDWKKLAVRPMLEERLEDGNIADVLIAGRSLEFLDFL